MALDDWIAECSSEPPCGPALDYDPEFMALEQLLLGVPERQYGSTVIPAQEPDWHAVQRSAEALLKRTKDLRVTGALARALVRANGMAGLGEVLSLTVALLETHWEDVHPRLILDGEADPIPRANALAMLSDGAGLVADLRGTAFFSHAGIKVTVRDAELGLSATNVSGSFSRSQLEQMLQERLSADGEAFADLHRAAELLGKCVSVCNESWGVEQSPDLSSLTQLLTVLVRAVGAARSRLQLATSGGSDADVGKQPVHVSYVGSTDSLVGRKIASRSDAVAMLDALCSFFEEHEPSSPVPIFLRRAQQLTGMSYLEIVKSVTPEGLGTVEGIIGRPSS